MRETIKGSGNLPKGHYQFVVDGVPKVIVVEGGYQKRIWTLRYHLKNDPEEKTAKLYLFGSQYQPIVLAIGGVKNGNDVDWDDDEVDGKCFECDLDLVKSKSGYENYKFENCEDSIPF